MRWNSAVWSLRTTRIKTVLGIADTAGLFTEATHMSAFILTE
jgi:hypothetical protein